MPRYTSPMNSSSMIDLAEELFPIYRSLAGPGNLKTLEILRERVVPELSIKGFDSGTRVFDWVVPDEYHVESASLVDPNGDVVCDFKTNNLSIVGHSTSIDMKLSLSELQQHLYSLPDQPEAVPYVTSYYKETWGFCLPQNKRDKLSDGIYHAKIASKKQPGQMHYGELLIQGELEDEILISTYICHPSMANNELSGPIVASYLARKILDGSKPRHSFRFIFIPETIGSLAYISLNLKELQSRVVAGYVLTCIGDERAHSMLPSRHGNTIADEIAQTILLESYPNLKIYPWSSRGSDERQFCAPGVDLPVASLMRSKYWEYPEYHTSLDRIHTVVTEEGLRGGLEMVTRVVNALEKNRFPIATCIGEPNLGSRGLYPTTSIKGVYQNTKLLLHILTWADGLTSLLEISKKSAYSFDEVCEGAQILLENELVRYEH